MVDCSRSARPTIRARSRPQCFASAETATWRNTHVQRAALFADTPHVIESMERSAHQVVNQAQELSPALAWRQYPPLRLAGKVQFWPLQLIAVPLMLSVRPLAKPPQLPETKLTLDS